MNTHLITKVCGLSHAENMLKVDKLDVNFIGLIFYPKSPRFVTTKSLPPTEAKKVGVFVNTSINEILSHIKSYNLSAVQLHGQESIELISNLRQAILNDPQLSFIEIWKAIPIKNKSDFKQCAAYEHHVDKFVFDTKTNVLGGSGIQFNWSNLEAYNLSTNFLLSGGISAEDADKICQIQHSKLIGVDLNSKFEIQPGLKDIKKLSIFTSQLKAYENSIV
ncbi:phosphoribosylanthranilate isomerase [Psychroflexus sp. ALD_RP9]|uniref:phosphoribosylanthranilate isomerase n=1 Tax=Psychroflexus sp. ALD_RP9 TaxID=2777186 RepID=UPI001A8CB64D|nr:phosphoribosylanthranilate isomerase [Psychroflexus sp. ALD_RP9]QSS97152.1 phosphoribosylanthranilate isomerase [Psychroflexus sp. ALD_RP9]